MSVVLPDRFRTIDLDDASLGRPPIPAQCPDQRPVEIASTSIDLSLVPNRMIEPLPKFLSI